MCEAKIIKIGKVRFRPYEQEQEIMLPVLLSSKIPPNHLSRVVDELVEGIDMEILAGFYPGGGSPSYHPKMLVKVWVYGYSQQVYTSRPLAKALREQLPFMWLAGCQEPCYKTLSDFRSGRFKEMLDEVFVAVLLYLVEHGYVELEDYFVDGTKMEANANRHKVVWRKNTERYKGRVIERIRELLARIDELNAEEEARYQGQDLAEMGEQSPGGPGSQALKQHAGQVNELAKRQQALAQGKAEKQKAKELAKCSRHLEKEAEKLAKYEIQEAILDGRNSYSKTDKSASCLRMKDERLLPNYNLQLGTENQYAVHFSVHQNASDSATLPEHLDKLSERMELLAKRSGADKRMPGNMMADEGYGCEENYACLEREEINSYLKYPGFHREQKGEPAPAFHKSRFVYNQAADSYTCPQGRKLRFVQESLIKTATGYERLQREYQSEGCQGCPLAGQCKKGEGPRTLAHSPNLEVYKAQAKANLCSEKGQQLRKRRGTEVETPFGDIKHNTRYRRFFLRGLEKVTAEAGLLAIARNARKLYCEKSGVWAQHYANRKRKTA